MCLQDAANLATSLNFNDSLWEKKYWYYAVLYRSNEWVFVHHFDNTKNCFKLFKYPFEKYYDENSKAYTIITKSKEWRVVKFPANRPFRRNYTMQEIADAQIDESMMAEYVDTFNEITYVEI